MVLFSVRTVGWQTANASLYLVLKDKLKSLADQSMTSRQADNRFPLTAEITTGAELIDFWEREGVIGSRPEIRDSAEHARRIRSEAERRPRNQG